MKNEEITILLSTYNGARYLPEQLRSICEQDMDNWRLLIRDDGSTDDTQRIIDEWILKYPGKIEWLHDHKGNLGAKRSYSELMQNCESPYVSFADQDDVWRADKLRLKLESMKSAEMKWGASTPILVYSDVELVDEEMRPIAASFMKFAGLSNSYVKNNTILRRNVAPGCSMMINRSLLKLAGNIDDGAIMHDYWLMLFACYCGKVSFISDTLVKYRQHSGNTIGALGKKEVTFRTLLRNFRAYLNGTSHYLSVLRIYQQQADSFLERFLKNDSRVNGVRAFVQLKKETGKLKRKRLILAYGLKMGSFMENLEMLLCG